MNENRDWRYKIEPLSPGHDRNSFRCGTPELDAYLRTQAGQDQKRKLSAVYVLTARGEAIAGYYTLSAGSINRRNLPEEFAHKLPSFPLPVTLLGRLAVSEQLQGRGLGEHLLMDALERGLNSSRSVASWAVVVDAKADARKFYLKHSFVPMLDPPVRLFLPMKVIGQVLE